MSKSPEGVGDEVLDSLTKGVENLYLFRDLYFEQEPALAAEDRERLVSERMRELLEEFQKVDESSLAGEQRARYLYLQGRAYNVASSYEASAARALSKAVKLSPRLVDAWNELGECYWKNLDIREAKSSFEGALRTVSSLAGEQRARYLYLQGRAYNVASSYEASAARALSKAVKLSPRLVDAWNELGECYWKNLDIREAKSSFEGALRTVSSLAGEQRARYLYLQGRAYNVASSYEASAARALSKAVKLSPRLVDAWNELGECYWKNLDIREAKSSFEGALRTVSSLAGEQRARYLYLQGRAYNVASSYEASAARALSKAVKLSPRLVDAWNELGECYWKNLDIREAKSSFEGALRTVSSLVGEQRARYLYLQGRAYNVASSYEASAARALSKAVKLSPRLVDAWNELGECYWKNLDIREAKSSFEGALRTARNKKTLRSLSIILRQEITHSTEKDMAKIKEAVQASVELAKEAVALDIKDGVSWSVLGNAYLCLYFMVMQDPPILKLCMSAYRQAELDPVARGQPDVYYNKGIALKYCERYAEALESFSRARRLEPSWAPPAGEGARLAAYVARVGELVRTRGKLKAKRLQQMVQSIDKKMLGVYGAEGTALAPRCLDELPDGANDDAVLLGKVVGSIYTENVVPFTFALVDSRACCVRVTVYNWADGRGVIIGDAVAVPQPLLATHKLSVGDNEVEFRSVRVDNPSVLAVNGKRISRDQVASTRITSTYQAV